MIRDLLTLLPFFVFLFWGLFFLLNKEKQHSKHVLGICMLVGAAMHLSLIVYYNPNSMALYLNYDWLYLFTSLLITPSYFLYIQTIAKRAIVPKDSVHFIPAGVFLVLYLILFISAPQEERIKYLKEFVMTRNNYHIELNDASGQIAFLYIINRIIFLTQIIIYSISAMKIFNKFKQRIENYYSETSGRELTWIKTLTICLFFVSIISVIFNLVGRSLFLKNDLFLSIPAIIFSVFFYLLGFTLNNQPFNIANLEEEEKEEEEEQKVFVVEDKIPIQPSKIRQNLECLMEEKQLYLTKDLRISALCRELNTNRTYLSQVLNDELNENFNSYINKYRVNHAILLLKNIQLQNYSLDKFAELSGFGSTVSMIRAFKQITGKTPSEFRN